MHLRGDWLGFRTSSDLGKEPRPGICPFFKPISTPRRESLEVRDPVSATLHVHTSHKAQRIMHAVWPVSSWMESGPESHKHRILEAGSTGKSLSTPHSLHLPG